MILDDRGRHRVLAGFLAGRIAEAETMLAPGERAEFARWAGEHRLSPFLHDLLPAESPLRGELAPAAHRELGLFLARKTWIPALIRAGRAEGVEFVAFKGAGVAHLDSVYRFPYLRPLGDLDLLVPEERMPAAMRAAESLGFRVFPDDPAVRDYVLTDLYHADLAHPEHGVLEIHHQLYRDIPAEVAPLMLSRSEPATIFGESSRRLHRRDLFFLLCVHFTITTGAAIWIWLVEILRLGNTLAAADWRELESEVTARRAQIFVAASFASLATLWDLLPASLPPDFRTRLDGELSRRERHEIEELTKRIHAGFIDGDRISMARRLSGRPVRGRKAAFSSLLCHPGAVCMELGVRSDARFFWWHRLRHAAIRTRRGLLAARS